MVKRKAKKVFQEDECKAYNELYRKLGTNEGEKNIYKHTKSRKMKTRDLMYQLKESTSHICTYTPRGLVKLQSRLLIITYKPKIHLVNTNVRLSTPPHNIHSNNPIQSNLHKLGYPNLLHLNSWHSCQGPCCVVVP